MNKENDGAWSMLSDVKRRQHGEIVSLPEDEGLRSQCIRLGLSVGASFECVERLPGGTIVLASFRQEIALGNSLARMINVLLSE